MSLTRAVPDFAGILGKIRLADTDQSRKSSVKPFCLGCAHNLQGSLNNSDVCVWSGKLQSKTSIITRKREEEGQYWPPCRRPSKDYAGGIFLLFLPHILLLFQLEPTFRTAGRERNAALFFTQQNHKYTSSKKRRDSSSHLWERGLLVERRAIGDEGFNNLLSRCSIPTMPFSKERNLNWPERISSQSLLNFNVLGHIIGEISVHGWDKVLHSRNKREDKKRRESRVIIRTCACAQCHQTTGSGTCSCQWDCGCPSPWHLRCFLTRPSLPPLHCCL